MMKPLQHRSSRFEPADFSHLRDFLRGYLHQDWPDEYASVTEAVKQFWMDTGTATVARVFKEWQALQQISGGRLKNTAEILGELGGAWNPTSRKDLDELNEALAKYRDRSGRK